MCKMMIAAEEEKKYYNRQSTQISAQTGCIGILRTNLAFTEPDPNSSWTSIRGYLETEEFIADFRKIRTELSEGRFEPFSGSRRTNFETFCYKNPEGYLSGKEYGYRIDTDKYTYLLRADTTPGNGKISIFCYKKDWLDQHIRCAREGIRFIDSSYNELFRIKDGGKIRITASDGSKEDIVCRYIDSYHVQLSDARSDIRHICEFGELMERIGSKYEPVV